MWDEDDLDRALMSTIGMLQNSLFSAGPSQPLSKVEVGPKFVTIIFDLPGVEKDEVVVTCTEEAVSVEAEVRRRTVVRGASTSVSERYARYSKEVRLPVKVVSEKGTAQFRNGMIIVRVPIKQERAVRESGKRLRLTA